MRECIDCSKETTAKERVEIELNDLKDKIVKLSGFLFSTKSTEANISFRMLSLMREQLDYMQKYAEILQRRLYIWGKTDEELRRDNERICW